MNDAKDTIPKTHLTEDGSHFMCPRCKNTEKFTILIQYQLLKGLGTPSFPSCLSLLANWYDYNTVICDECSFYLTWGGARWRPVDEDAREAKPKKSREKLLKSIPLDVLEEMLREKEKECKDCEYFSNVGGPYCEKDGTSEIAPPFKGYACFKAKAQ